jgi:hypothetical protein
MLFVTDQARPVVEYDAVIVGSGFGGTMVAYELVSAGWRVLMVERGDWVRRGLCNWAAEGVGFLTHRSSRPPYRVLAGGETDVVGSFACVGGPSVFYGGASLRFRAADFEPAPEIVGDSAARWPLGYDDLETHYARAERLIGVAGQEGDDPTEPSRSAPYLHPGGALAPTSRRIWEAARGLGLHPFRLPLAFNHARTDGRRPCAACGTCDLFACAIGAKNDLATAVLPGLLRRGRGCARTVAVRLLARSGRWKRSSASTGHGHRLSSRPRSSCSPPNAGVAHLVLASGLERTAPAQAVATTSRGTGAVVAGLFRGRRAEGSSQAGRDPRLLLSDPGSGARRQARGLQRLSPPPALVRDQVPAVLGGALMPFVADHGDLVIAEDQPSRASSVAIGLAPRPRGLPQLLLVRRCSRRDRRPAEPRRHARRILPMPAPGPPASSRSGPSPPWARCAWAGPRTAPVGPTGSSAGRTTSRGRRRLSDLGR